MAQGPRQETQLSFKEWLLLNDGSRSTSNKTGLYPLGYGGIGLYPIQDYLTHSADAFTYTTMDQRIYHGQEGAPFKITHLNPTPTFTHPESPLPEPKTPKGYKAPDGMLAPKSATAPGGKVAQPTGHGMPGKEVKPKNSKAPK